MTVGRACRPLTSTRGRPCRREGQTATRRAAGLAPEMSLTIQRTGLPERPRRPAGSVTPGPPIRSRPASSGWIPTAFVRRSARVAIRLRSVRRGRPMTVRNGELVAQVRQAFDAARDTRGSAGGLRDLFKDVTTIYRRHSAVVSPMDGLDCRHACPADQQLRPRQVRGKLGPGEPDWRAIRGQVTWPCDGVAANAACGVVRRLRGRSPGALAVQRHRSGPPAEAVVQAVRKDSLPGREAVWGEAFRFGISCSADPLLHRMRIRVGVHPRRAARKPSASLCWSAQQRAQRRLLASTAARPASRSATSAGLADVRRRPSKPLIRSWIRSAESGGCISIEQEGRPA
jgi:hypothetical protein